MKSNYDVLHEKINPLIKSTARTGLVNVHSLSGVFDIKTSGYEDPYLVSGTDGVGTKLKVNTEICWKFLFVLFISFKLKIAVKSFLCQPCIAILKNVNIHEFLLSKLCCNNFAFPIKFKCIIEKNFKMLWNEFKI